MAEQPKEKEELAAAADWKPAAFSEPAQSVAQTPTDQNSVKQLDRQSTQQSVAAIKEGVKRIITS